MKILIFSAFEPIPSDGILPIRYARIAEEFLQHGHEVIFIAPTFFHLNKTQRKQQRWNINGDPEKLQLKLINAPTYTSHSGLKRIYSHYILALNLKRYLKKASFPDLIITAYPPITANYFLAKWAKQNSVPYIVDVQDVWPYSFGHLIPIRFLSKILLNYLKRQFSFITKNAKAISTVSADFIPYIRIKKNASIKVFHLGTNTAVFPAGKIHQEKSNAFKILYIGNASTNIILKKAVIAVSKIPNTDLHIIGLKNAAAEMEEFCRASKVVNVKIIPWLQQDELAKASVDFDAALLLVNPNSFIAFPYKAFTYFAAGLPVINNIRGGEIEKLVSINNFGITLKADTEAFIKDAIYEMMQNKSAYNRENIKQFAARNFDKTSIYRQYYIWAMQVFNRNA